MSQPDADVRVTRLAGVRRVAARRMTEAWSAPMFHLTVQVDMTNVLPVSRHVAGATVTDALLYACSRALVANPALNAHYENESLTQFGSVNLALAVSTDEGLTVPVIHSVETLTVPQIRDRRKELVGRARAGKLVRADVEGATFTLSNLGMLGIDRFDAILNPPQVGILAVGATQPRATVEAGHVVVRPVAEMTLTCDHRALDGVAGARMLATLKQSLEAGQSWPVD